MELTLAKPIVILLSWTMLIAILVYLVTLVALITGLKNEQVEYWQRISSPRLLDPNGQISVFWKIICGADIPKNVAAKYKLKLKIVRMSLIVGLSIFFILMAATLSQALHAK